MFLVYLLYSELPHWIYLDLLNSFIYSDYLIKVCSSDIIQKKMKSLKSYQFSKHKKQHQPHTRLPSIRLMFQKNYLIVMIVL